MCGIVAYVGRKIAQPVLIEGLKRLEYRGYDSAGIAVIDNKQKLHIRRAVGRISVLENSLSHGEALPSAHLGNGAYPLGDPRRADGMQRPSAHGRQRADRTGSQWSHRKLRRPQAISDGKGAQFSSQTDTEVLAVLIGDLYTELKAKNHQPTGTSLLQNAVQAALHEVQGTYGIAVICKDEPDTLVVARKGSPLIIGVGRTNIIVASDSSAIVEHTASVIYLNDNEMAVLRPDGFRTSTIDDVELNPVISQLENKIEAYELGNL